MKRDYLESLGIDKAIIDQIMAEHGKDITALTEQRDGVKQQLADAQKALKGFEGVDVGELQGKIAQLGADLAAKDTQYQQQLADMQFSANLERAVTSAKARSSKAVMALLDVEKLKASKNQDADIAAALEAVKGEHAYMFDAGRQPVAPTPGAINTPPPAAGNTAAANEALRSYMKGDS